MGFQGLYAAKRLVYGCFILPCLWRGTLFFSLSGSSVYHFSKRAKVQNPTLLKALSSTQDQSVIQSLRFCNFSKFTESHIM